MIVWRALCCLVAVAAVGCVGREPCGSLGRMSERLDRIEQVRLADASREASSAGLFRLTSHSADAPAVGSTAKPLAFMPYASQDTTKDVTAREFTTATEEHARFGPMPGLWETIKRDVKQMPGELWRDTKKVYTSAPNLLILGVTYGGALALQETGPDSTVEDRLHGHDIFSDDVNDSLGVLGNPGTHFALAGAWYLLGQQTQDEKTYDVGKNLFSALIVNGLSTMVGQAASWDHSPNGEWGTFPSGHTSSTFCFASVMHESYGPLVGFPLYGLGTLVAIERLDDDEHYFADVVMGAVLGLVVGHSIAGEQELELFGGQIMPYADPYTASTGVAWVRHFK